MHSTFAILKRLICINNNYSSINGVQAYYSGSLNVDVKASSTENGVLCGVTDTWWF